MKNQRSHKFLGLRTDESPSCISKHAVFCRMAEPYSSSDDDDCDWDEMEQEGTTVLCLFCQETFPTTDDVFEHCASLHEFDIKDVASKYSLEELSYVQLINYIREHGCKPQWILKVKPPLSPSDEPVPWDKPEYLRPALHDDMLLTYDILRHEDTSRTLKYAHVTQREYEELQSRLQRAEAIITDMRKTACVFLHDSPAMTNSFPIVGHLKADEDEAYFETYSHFGIHHEMLTDIPRTDAYRIAMENNASSSIEGKTVLDVGCGTGILSMFAARCGARKVFGIDQSEIAYSAIDIIRENNLEKTVTILKGRLEDVDLPSSKVDVIVSEWMGYFLLFEGMMDTVLYARDKHLKPGGLILPDVCSMFVVALSDKALHKKHVKCWDDMWGFKMSCMKTDVVKEAQVTSVPPEGICSEPFRFKTLDLNTCTPEDCDFSSKFTLQLIGDATEITALAGYFDCQFSLPSPVILSTSPHAKPTHWQQTVFLFEHPVSVKPGAVIHGTIDCRRDPKRRRELSVTITLDGRRYPTYHLR